MGEKFVPEDVVESIVRSGKTEVPKEVLEQERQKEAVGELWVRDTRLKTPVTPPEPNEALPRKDESGLIRTSYMDLLRDGALELADNRWRLEGSFSMGAGSYGRVYKAFDTKLGIPVALKVGRHINNTFDVEREAKAMANIAHPGVVKVYDFTIQDAPNGHGLPIIVEEYMDPKEAPSLADRIKSTKHLEAHEITKIVSELSQTTDYLYFEKGLLHNDLKPANIFLDPHFTKMGDFGLASAVHRSGYGTNIYKAPECFHPQNRNSLQAEVFSLGVIVYEILTGKLPIQGTSEYKYDGYYFETPEMVETYGEEGIERLKMVLKKALSVNPEERYQTATKFSQALAAAFAKD